MKYFQLFILFFIGCGYKHDSHDQGKAIDTNTVRFVKFPYIATEMNIQKLVDRIDSSDCVYFGKIGFVGEENEIYDSYQRLLEIAPDSIWFNLSYNKNPVIRVYAFKALETKKSSHLQDVKGRLQEDKATVCYVAADTRTSFSISFFVSNAK